MAGVQEYKCPCCGGAIEFNSSIQKMKCPYCDTEFEVDALKAYDEALKEDQPDEMTWDSRQGDEWSEEEKQGLKIYHCESCGAEIVADQTLGATVCPYCDNPVVFMGQFAGGNRPDYIIPFQFDKKAAKEALKGHCKGKRLLPKVFKDENHIDEMKGVYVPVWLFDAKADASLRFRATRTRSWSDSHYNYVETSHYLVQRAGDIAFEKIPVDGSEKMNNTLMESIEPFDFTKAVPFQTAYMAGYLADKYDVDDGQCEGRANDRVKKSTEEAFERTVYGYTSVVPENSNIQLTHGKTAYALYPVWMLNTTWHDQKYTFCMNGQTGKIVGDLPMDKGLFWKYFGLSALIGGGIAFLLNYLIWLI
jgi:DNA-directed RNA polymerase subunit RPC12/RpoP